MRKRRISQFVKEYFYFSQTERKGIIGLLVILVFLMSVPSLYGLVFPSRPLAFKIENIPVRKYDSLPVTEKSNVRNLFPFDPNSASDAELEQLGLTAKNITTIRRYQSKGGCFREPQDLKKVFGIDKELAERLIPYVSIRTTPRTSSRFQPVKHVPVVKKEYQKPVEINTADTADLIALYRIGPVMAKRIIEYRSKLGGFISLNQLTEVYGFDEDILYDLKGKIAVDAGKVHVFNLNEVTAAELKTHPYFKYKLSNAIVNYRQQHGPYQSLQDLRKIVLVNDSIYRNITMYLRIK